MIMGTLGRGNFIGSVKNRLVYEEYILEVRVHRVCLNDVYGMEFVNNSRMAFF
jgi:hypothetical protein